MSELDTNLQPETGNFDDTGYEAEVHDIDTIEAKRLDERIKEITEDEGNRPVFKYIADSLFESKTGQRDMDFYIRSMLGIFTSQLSEPQVQAVEYVKNFALQNPEQNFAA